MRTMTSISISISVALAAMACHHEDRAAAPARPRAMAERTPPPPVVDRSVVTDADADLLAADIRAPSTDLLQAATLQRWVTGPVVILDADRGDVRTACGADANDSARAWGTSITDPSEPAPVCHVQVDRIFCEQKGTKAGAPQIGMYFERGRAWRLTALVLTRVGREVPEPLINDFAARVQSPRCP